MERTIGGWRCDSGDHRRRCQVPGHEYHYTMGGHSHQYHSTAWVDIRPLTTHDQSVVRLGVTRGELFLSQKCRLVNTHEDHEQVFYDSMSRCIYIINHLKFHTYVLYIYILGLTTDKAAKSCSRFSRYQQLARVARWHLSHPSSICRAALLRTLRYWWRKVDTEFLVQEQIRLIDSNLWMIQIITTRYLHRRSIGKYPWRKNISRSSKLSNILRKNRPWKVLICVNTEHFGLINIMSSVCIPS